MDLYRILNNKCCKVNLKAKTKEDTVSQIAELAKKSSLLDKISLEEVTKAIMERESQGSTGFSDGVAIPHARLKGLDDFLMLIAVSKKGIDFDSLDKKKSKIFVLILAPEEKVNEHLKVLAGVSRILASEKVRNEIVACSSEVMLAESFLRHVRSDEKEMGVSRTMKLLNLVLFYEEYVYDILELFIEEGVEGANIVDSYGMGEYISNVPLFAGFLNFMAEENNKSKTITALVPDDMIDNLVKRIEEITGDLETKQGAVIIVTDVSYYKGTMKMM